MNITVKGVITKEVDFSDFDKYIELLTYNHGKISVLCKGVRKKNSRLASKTRLFNFAEFEIFSNRSTYILNDVLLIEQFFEITEDIEHYAVCCYFLELCSKLCDEDSINIHITRALISSLYAIKTKKDQKLVKSAIELRMMSLAGFFPTIDKCGLCLEKENLKRPVFDTINGTLICGDCKEKLEINKYFEITQGVVHAMYHILSCDIEKLYNFKLDELSFNILCKLCEDYVLTQTDIKFKTLDFYKSIGGN